MSIIVKVDDRLSINVEFVAALVIDHKHYMNGTEAMLCIKMEDGVEYKRRHGYGFDVYKMHDAITAAIKANRVGVN